MESLSPFRLTLKKVAKTTGGLLLAGSTLLGCSSDAAPKTRHTVPAPAPDVSAGPSAACTGLNIRLTDKQTHQIRLTTTHEVRNAEYRSTTYSFGDDVPRVEVTARESQYGAHLYTPDSPDLLELPVTAIINYGRAGDPATFGAIATCTTVFNFTSNR